MVGLVQQGKIVAVSGGFDPIHDGHIAYLKEALTLGSKLIVILTRDDQLIKKKGKFWIPYESRKGILEWILERKGKEFKVVPNMDEDLTSCNSLVEYMPIDIFAKGGNTWSKWNLPEWEICENLCIKVMFGIGGFLKERGSSEVLEWEK